MASPAPEPGAKSAATSANGFFNVLKQLKLEKYHSKLGNVVNMHSLSDFSDVKNEDLRTKVKMKDREIKVLREHYLKTYPAAKKKKSSERGRLRSFVDMFRRTVKEPKPKQRTTVWYNDYDVTPNTDGQSQGVQANTCSSESTSVGDLKFSGRAVPKSSTESTCSTIQDGVDGGNVVLPQQDTCCQTKAGVPSMSSKSKRGRRRKKSKQESTTTLATTTEQPSRSALSRSHNCLLKRRSATDIDQFVSIAMKKSNSSREVNTMGVTSTKRTFCSGQAFDIGIDNSQALCVVVITDKRQSADCPFENGSTTMSGSSCALSSKYSGRGNVRPINKHKRLKEKQSLPQPPPIPRRGKTHQQGRPWSEIISHEFDYKRMFSSESYEDKLRTFSRRSVWSFDHEYMSLIGRYENVDERPEHVEGRFCDDDSLAMQFDYENMPQPDGMLDFLDVPELTLDQEGYDCSRMSAKTISKDSVSEESLWTSHSQGHQTLDEHDYENVDPDAEPGEGDLYDCEENDYENVPVKPSERSVDSQLHSGWKHETDGLKYCCNTREEGRSRKRSDSQYHVTQADEQSGKMEADDYVNLPSGYADFTEEPTQVTLDEDSTLTSSYENFPEVGRSATFPRTKRNLSHLKEHHGYMCPLDVIRPDDSGINCFDVDETDFSVPVTKSKRDSTCYVGPEWENELTSNLNSCSGKVRRNQHSQMNYTNTIPEPCSNSRKEKDNDLFYISAHGIDLRYGYNNLDSAVEDSSNFSIQLCSDSRDFVFYTSNERVIPHYAYENLE
ncbi:uncharacterized protein [Ptychodera flava]|uniref:uncharacterized protein n=1 Tax=Ptychodera flava TaxID=63121 RepID=UPI00396A1FA4